MLPRPPPPVLPVLPVLPVPPLPPLPRTHSRLAPSPRRCGTENNIDICKLNAAHIAGPIVQKQGICMTYPTGHFEDGLDALHQVHTRIPACNCPK